MFNTDLFQLALGTAPFGSGIARDRSYAILDAYMRSQIAMDTAISYAQDPDSMEQKVRIF